MRSLIILSVAGALLAMRLASPACELCAIYSASNASGDSSSGFNVNIAELFVMQNTLQFQGEKFDLNPFLNNSYLNSWTTHLVPGYNFSSRFGISASLPYIYRTFRRVEFTSTGGFIDEEATESGIGDASLILRWAPIHKNEMTWGVIFNVLAGVKFPTGDRSRLDDEVDRARSDLALFGPGHQHSSVAGIHQSDLTLGSGSYDGIFGTSLRARWQRFFFNNQLQYYLKTEADGYEYADYFIASGGPGGYIWLNDKWTASVQANVFYETSGSDELIGQPVPHTGIAAWYVGPQVNLTIGEHFAFNIALDLPVHIFNRGLMVVPDYRVHGGLTFNF